jgi:hypothetical protein
MGFLSFFTKSKSVETDLMRLPSGSFTVDRNGRLLVSTLPQTFPPGTAREIADLVIATFQSAQEAQMPLAEFTVDYAALKLTARELKGGAIIFFNPRTFRTA